MQASSPSAQSTLSTDALLPSGNSQSKTPVSLNKAALQAQKRSSWFSFKQQGSNNTDVLPAHRASTEIHLDSKSQIDPNLHGLLALLM